MKHQTKLACTAHAEHINLKLVKQLASNVQISLVDQELQLELELVQQVNAKRDVHLANTSTQNQASVVHAATASSSQTRDHLFVKFVAWDKQRDQLRLNLAQSAEMNAHQACNWELMENVSHAHEAHIARKEFSQHVKHVHSDEQHPKLAHRQSKNVHCQFAHPELISMRQSMCVLNVAKATTSQNLSRLLAFHAHQIIALKTLPQLLKPNVQIHARLPLKVINIAM